MQQKVGDTKARNYSMAQRVDITLWVGIYNNSLQSDRA